MQSFAQPEFKSPLVVVAHDAGAANLIISWLNGREDIEIRLCLTGPAKELWPDVHKHSTQMTPHEALKGAAQLLSGTSYSSCLEHMARVSANKSQIHSIGVIDHWVNYQSRFIRDGLLVLPDEIWVVDQYAVEIANSCFPCVKIVLQKNLYLDRLLAHIRATSGSLKISASQNFLYVLEPIRQQWADKGKSGEFEALDYFLHNGWKVGLNRSTKILLRPHPSDPVGKYDSWIAMNNGWNIKIDTAKSLADSIAWSDTVVGCESYALAVAVSAGRRVISTLPPHAPSCRLPFEEIIRLSEL